MGNPSNKRAIRDSILRSKAKYTENIFKKIIFKNNLPVNYRNQLHLHQNMLGGERAEAGPEGAVVLHPPIVSIGRKHSTQSLFWTKCSPRG
jgi:hypothetical protein